MVGVRQLHRRRHRRQAVAALAVAALVPPNISSLSPLPFCAGIGFNFITCAAFELPPTQYLPPRSDDGSTIAYIHHQPSPTKAADSFSNNARLGLIFFPGFLSNMHSSKACRIFRYAQTNNLECTLFDRYGHGASRPHYSSDEYDGRKATMGRWLDDSLTILDDVTATSNKQILIGSSMGTWLAILAAMQRPERVAGIIGIASAPDYTALLRRQIGANDDWSNQLKDLGYVDVPTVYDRRGYYRLHEELLVEGENHLICCPAFALVRCKKPWKAGRRDILDYGTGNGLLASQLAEAGASSVTAVDINSKAVQAAQKRLEPYPSATARGTRPLQWTVAVAPGIIGYRNRFDTVVSYRGALSYGMTPLERIQPYTTAIKCAARATREGGKVIAVNFGPDYKTPLKFAYLLTLGVFAWNQEIFRSIAMWKLNLGIFLSSLPFAGLNILFVVTARWVALLKQRVEGPLEISFGFTIVSLLSIFSMIWIPGQLWVEYQHEKKRKLIYQTAMSNAGLTDFKRTRKVLLHPYKRLSDGPGTGLISFLINSAEYLKGINIYEGTKKSKST